MPVMKEISDACLTLRMTVYGFLIAGVAIGTAASLLFSSVWIGAGLGIAAGVVTGYLISQLPWKYY